MSVRFCHFKRTDIITYGIYMGGSTNGANGFTDNIIQSNIFDTIHGVYASTDPSVADASIGHHFSNNVFYNSGYGEVGALEYKYFGDVISYNNIYHSCRITLMERKPLAGRDFRYLDYDQDYGSTLAFMYINEVAKTLAQVQAETIFADNTATVDPNFVDLISYVPQAAESLTGGVDGSQRGLYLTGTEVLRA